MNNIRKFSKDFLIDFRRLEQLHLDQNRMVQMPDLHWVRHMLQNIRMYRNNISSLDAFRSNAPFKSLLYIDMGFNNIWTFNVTFLRQMTRQRKFILDFNQLTYVDDFRGKILSQLIYGITHGTVMQNYLGWRGRLCFRRPADLCNPTMFAWDGHCWHE